MQKSQILHNYINSYTYVNVNVLYGDISCKQLNVPKLSVCENVVNVLIVGVRNYFYFLSGTELKYFISRIRE